MTALAGPAGWSLGKAGAMSLGTPLSPAAARASDAVDDAARIVRDIRSALADLIPRATSVAAHADWRAPSARAFGDRIDSWRGDLLAASSRADEVLDSLARTGAELRARAWDAVA
jgi:hypothetical protein